MPRLTRRSCGQAHRKFYILSFGFLSNVLRNCLVDSQKFIFHYSLLLISSFVYKLTTYLWYCLCRLAFNPVKKETFQEGVNPDGTPHSKWKGYYYTVRDRRHSSISPRTPSARLSASMDNMCVAFAMMRSVANRTFFRCAPELDFCCMHVIDAVGRRVTPVLCAYCASGAV